MGAVGCCVSCGSNVCMGLSDMLGINSLLSNMYFVLSVRLCGWSLDWLGQFVVQLG